MIRRPPRSTRKESSAASDVYKRQVEKKFTQIELYNAKEVFLTSASSFIMPIVQIDDQNINQGLVGNISLKLRKLYFDNFKH